MVDPGRAVEGSVQRFNMSLNAAGALDVATQSDVIDQEVQITLHKSETSLQ